MDKPLACFEISSRSVKLVVGYQLDKHPVVLYTKEEPIEGIISDGHIINRDALIDVLKKFRTIDDKDKKITLSITEAYLVLPSFGLSVFQNNKTTNVVSNESLISRIDITNVISLVNKETIPNGNVIVDIIPDEFVLDNGARFTNPPVGERSNTLTIRAKVHVLPSEIYSSYVGAMNDAGFKIKKSAVSSYCFSEFFSKDPNLPQTYALLDIGSKISTVSFMGRGSAYSSLFFNKGSENITEDIATQLGVDLDTARSIKEKYGFDDTPHSYNPPIYDGLDQYGNKISFTQIELNNLLSKSMETYCSLLANSLKTILSPYGGKYDNIPLFITGGGSQLYGLPNLLTQIMGNYREYIPLENNVVGASSPSYSALLGLIMIASDYKGSLADNQHGVRNLNRSEKTNDKTDDEI